MRAAREDGNSSDAPQRVQSSTESWASGEMPSSVRNEPAGHGLHVVAPEDEYLPAGQTWQLPSLPTKVPAGQSSQSSTLSWEVAMPSSAMVMPAGHTEHVPVPMYQAYEAAGHTEHWRSSAENMPTAQWLPQESQDPPSTSAGVLVP